MWPCKLGVKFLTCSLFSSFFLLLQIIKALGVEKVINKLGAAVVGPNFSWKVIFLLVAALLSDSPDCCENLGSKRHYVFSLCGLKLLTFMKTFLFFFFSFLELIDELILHGLEGGRQTELSAGILLARQCCSCDSKNFGSYSIWFSSHFGPDSVTARNPIQFLSLLQLLTDIVPAESAEILRVHINKVFLLSSDFLLNLLNDQILYKVWLHYYYWRKKYFNVGTSSSYIM